MRERAIRPSSDDRVVSSTVRALAVLLLAALPVYFLALGANSIWDANEAFYVETPRQMVESGDYVTPYWNGELRVNKPVLSYWIVAGLYQLVRRVGRGRARRASRSARWGSSSRRSSSAARSVRPPSASSRRSIVATAPRDGDVLAPHLHRRLHHPVHGAGAGLLRHGRAASRTPAPLPARRCTSRWVSAC